MVGSKKKPKSKPQVQPGQDDARQRIIACARQHFFAHGFRSVTMEDLARELGMSKKTLYAHFPGKPDLIEAAIGDKLRALDADLGLIEKNHKNDSEGRLREFLAHMHAHLGELSPTFVRDMRSVAPEVWRSVESRRAAIVERYFGKLIRDGQRTGLIRDDLSPQFITEVLLGLLQTILNPQKLALLKLEPQTAAKQVLSTILNGVFTSRSKAKP